MRQFIIKCAVTKFGECNNELGTVNLPEGAEFGEFYHCPECMKKFRERDEEVEG